jgi:hypothetical protein
MKRTLTALGALMITTTPALAYGGPETTETSLFITLLMGFAIIIIAGQLIPGLILFYSTIRAIFGKTVKETVPATGR